MQRSFFDVTPLELGQLGTELAVAVLREMLWAEINYLGIPISDTDVPFAVNDADGGVDAIVKGTPKGAGSGLIFPPTTSYQVKAGDFSVSATRPAQIEELLMTPTAIRQRIGAKASPAGTSHKPDGISPRVRACLDAGGTFVTMLFGNDGVETEEDATENAIRKFLGEMDAKYKDAKVKVWRQSRICGLLRQFPGVSLQIKNRADLGLLTHDQWTARLDMRQAFVAAPDQQKVMESLRAAIRDGSQGAIHDRVYDSRRAAANSTLPPPPRTSGLPPAQPHAEPADGVLAHKLDPAVLNARVIASSVLTVTRGMPRITHTARPVSAIAQLCALIF
jgi:hypothetical protein